MDTLKHQRLKAEVPQALSVMDTWMEDSVHVYQRWLTMSIQSHVVARGAFTINFLLSALFAAKSYGQQS